MTVCKILSSIRQNLFLLRPPSFHKITLVIPELNLKSSPLLFFFEAAPRTILAGRQLTVTQCYALILTPNSSIDSWRSNFTLYYQLINNTYYNGATPLATKRSAAARLPPLLFGFDIVDLSSSFLDYHWQLKCSLQWIQTLEH